MLFLFSDVGPDDAPGLIADRSGENVLVPPACTRARSIGLPP